MGDQQGRSHGCDTFTGVWVMRKTLARGSYCPDCGVRQDDIKHKERGHGPTHLKKCPFSKYRIVRGALKDFPNPIYCVECGVKMGGLHFHSCKRKLRAA